MGKRILVADDSLTIQQAFAMVMEGSGYSLSFARSVDEALSVAKKDSRPDLVLADVGLGNGSGYDLCAELRADALLQDVPVFILASTQSPYDEARGRKVGADGYMAKPFESQALLDAVASALVSPARQPAAVGASAMPEFAEHNDNTARIAASELPSEDDDSYGEITIERAQTAPTPPAPAWNTKPPTRPSGMRPIPAAAPTPPPAAPSPRPSLIPGARPSASMPAVRTGSTPQPAVPAPAPAAARPQMARTMMGFPSIKPPMAGKPQPPATAPAAPAAPVAPPKPSPPPSAAPAIRAPALTTPFAPASPVAFKPPISPAAPPVMPPAPRPMVPRVSPVPPTTASALVPPSARRVPTPIPPSAFAALSAPVPSAAMAAAVSSAVDQKVAALAARGPEYEAIAKLSREIIEQVVWEVVPELAEAIIRQEVDRLASAKK
jgi:DNA-binding response OmpR family regulator